jgi:hypothetical protein
VVQVARRLRRRAYLLGLGGLALVTATGCFAPQFTYVTDSTAMAYFKVPYHWHKIDDTSLSTELKSSGFSTGTGIWDVGYDANGTPSATHVLSGLATKPFALALVTPLSQAGSNAMSYNLLRDFILPVTSTSRQAAAKRGFPLQGFQLLSDSVIKPGKDVHGIREVFSYTYPDGHTDTFDQVALTNSDSTMVYLLLVHCLSTCYSHDVSQINTVMTSFTVGSH